MRIKKEHVKLNPTIKPRTIVSLLPGLFYLANLVRLLNISTIPYYITMSVTGLVGILYLFLQKKYAIKALLLYGLVYIVFLFLNWALIGNFGIDSIANNVLLFGITVIMLLFPWGRKSGAAVFYLSALLILFFMSISKDQRIFSSSTNYISVVILLACAFYYVAVELDSGRIGLKELIPAFICFFISVKAEGRGGILSSTFLLVLLILLYMRTVTKKDTRSIIVLLLLISAAILFLYIKKVNPIEVFLGLGKWAKRGTDNTARLHIWGSYYLKVKESIRYFLFGAPLKDIPEIAKFDGNTHNNLIQLHAYCGIVPFLITIVLMCRAFFYYCKSRKFILAAMMATIILRGMTDKFIFGQFGMPITLFFIFYPYIDKQNKKASFVPLDVPH